MTKHSRRMDARTPAAATPVETTDGETAAAEAPAIPASERKPNEDRFEKYRIRFALEII